MNLLALATTVFRYYKIKAIELITTAENRKLNWFLCSQSDSLTCPY